MGLLLGYQYIGETTHRINPQTERKGFGAGTHACQDGFVAVLGGYQFWPGICRMIDRPDLLDDPELSTPIGQTKLANMERFDLIWYPWIAERTKRQIIEKGQAAGALCGPINTTEDLLNDPHWKARGFWTEVEHPITGQITYPGAPFNMEKSPGRISSPAPLLGQHNTEIYADLGYSKADLVELKERGII